MRTDTKELNLKEVLDELDTQISELIMIREQQHHMKGICKYQAE